MQLLSTKNKRRLRRVFERRSLIVTADEARRVRFYQFKPSTAEFFHRQLGRSDIAIQDTPHFQLAHALAHTSDVAKAEAFYVSYLTASWGGERSNEFPARLEAFKKHFEAFRSGARMPRPVLSYLSKAAAPFALDGNHRLSFAAVLGQSVKCEVLPPSLALLDYSNAKEFYGTGYRERPYQSVYLNGSRVMEGRRDDAVERMKMIPSHVLQGRTVLDVACNIGMSSLLARASGAASCLGLERSAGMVDMATRFSMFEGAFPTVRFRQFDIDEDSLPREELYDTAFMFSIHDHLRNPERLLAIARDNVKRFVVFEGHPGTQKEKYAHFFDSGLFANVVEVGRLSESRINNDPSHARILWICAKA